MTPPKHKALPVIGLATLASVTALAYWPQQPALERREQLPTPTLFPLEVRPARPPHPASVYTPKALR